MQYRHIFHAGNFADVHKHIAVLALVQSLQAKSKGFQYLDTHAGTGLYDLNNADARRSNESEAGISQLERAAAQNPGAAHAAIRALLDAVGRIRRAHGHSHSLYPGSPLLVAAQLREVDQAILVESHAQTARALQRALHSSALLRMTPRVVSGDGYAQIRAALPPALRRGLTLIDPPYESADEEQQIRLALQEGVARFETGVFAVWYPIKKQYDTDLWLARVTRGITRPTLCIELCLREPDHTAGLNGSGLLIINPPWQFDTDAAAWQNELHALLGGTSGSRVHWLVHE
jgi:23S rRNA (adenine2030-N6)-methyltransferase